MLSSLGRVFEPLFPSTAWLAAVELSRLTPPAACCQILCSCCRHPVGFVWYYLGSLCGDGSVTHSQNIQAATIVDYPWRGGRWPVSGLLPLNLPGSQDLLLFLEVLCQDLLSHYQLTYHFPQVRSSLHLITSDLVRGVSAHVNLALELISDLLEGFSRVISDQALHISSELVICQVLQELVFQKLVLICDCCCIQKLYPCQN